MVNPLPGASVSHAPERRSRCCPHGFFTFSILVPVAAAAILYWLEPMDPSPMPIHELTEQPIAAIPERDGLAARHAQLIGLGRLLGPEDLAYDSESRIIYTGCMDGWIRRVSVGDSAADSVVEDWVFVGGRPLGVTLGPNKEVLVANPDKGLLNISREGEVQVLTDEAEGLKFKLLDGIDIAADGMIYFTDASYKYSLAEFMLDFLEGKPHGRLMSYNPLTKMATVLLRDLYFANGVVVAPDQTSVIFCETTMKRCRKYYIKGDKKGSVESFVVNVPGMPDNIKYDGNGQFWIGIANGISSFWDVAFRYPLIRKVSAALERYKLLPRTLANSGVLAVDLTGRPTGHYFDPSWFLISSGLKIGNRLYCGSVTFPYLITLNLTQHTPPADA